MCKSLVTAVLAAVVFTPATASAELRRVQFKVEGMSCAYCNTTMSAAIQKLDGVEKVQLSADEGLVIVQLKADNKITLAQLRRLVRGNGYPTTEAEITARGKLVSAEGHPAFDLMNGSTLRLADDSPKSSDGVVELKAVATSDARNEETIRVVSVSKK